MKYVSAAQAFKFENGLTCTAFEYNTEHTGINIARIEISGRYPDAGSAVNRVVTELVYVESGTGTVAIGDARISLQKGDVISIDPGESASWEGNLTLIIACTPAWSPDQYEMI